MVAPRSDPQDASREGGDRPAGEPTTRARGNDEFGEASVLVVANHGNTTKIARHWAPLGDVAGDVTMVCLDTDPDVDALDYRQVPAPGHRTIGILLLFFVALRECARGEYDAVASISLVPYGLYALVLGGLFDLPTHLGIIGSDLDRHAVSWYGAPVRAAFRRFNAISVPGETHADRLVEMGVPPSRVAVLANAIDVDRFTPTAGSATVEYDFAWVGRFGPEKDPLCFVRALAELRDRGLEFDAVMVGSGRLAGEVERARERHGLESSLSLAGWVDDPLSFYARSGTYVLTSRRDALPLTLLEAMATGLPVVVPDVGSVTDPVAHGETGYVVETVAPEALADALEVVLVDEELHARLARNAPRVRESYSYASAREDWRAILAVLTRSSE